MPNQPAHRIPSRLLEDARRTLGAPGLLVTELLAGLVVALALIPEAISFALIAGVDPKLGLYASFVIAMTIAFTGGRPAMISAATGAMALVVVSLVADHGAEYLLAATVLAGVVQVALGALGVAKLMRFIPRSVMTGFINSLAIFVFIAQLPYLREVSVAAYVLLVLGLAIIWVMPRVTRVVPAPFVAIVIVTAVTLLWDVAIPTVGDQGELPDALPVLGIPGVPFTFETLAIILPYSITLAAVGLLESLLTARLVDDITDTVSDKDREARGQGIANVISGLLGGMPGCAVIGQTMINVKVSGARTRLSTFCAGLFLLVLVLALSSLVAVIPMAALVAVMLFVSASTFEWRSLAPATLRRMPRGETVTMLATMMVTVTTHNLAIGVAAGVVCEMVVFARRVARMVHVTSELHPDGTVRTYSVQGQLFFASDRELIGAFDYAGDPERVVIDMSRASIWDTSAVAALDAIEARYARHGVQVTVVGMDARSERMHGRYTASAVEAGTDR